MAPRQLGQEKRWWFDDDTKEPGIFLFVRNSQRKEQDGRCDRGSRLVRKGRGTSKGMSWPVSRIASISPQQQPEPSTSSGLSQDNNILIEFSDSKDVTLKTSLDQFDWNQSEISNEMRDFVDSSNDFCAAFKQLKAHQTKPVGPEEPEEETATNENDETESEIEGAAIDEEEGPELNDEIEKIRPSKRKLSTAKMAAKKKKLENTNTVKRINLKEKFVGHLCINVGALINGIDASRNIRPIDQQWKAALKRRILNGEFKDDNQPLLLCVKETTKEDFNEKNINGYNYEVLGGQHLVLAMSDIGKEFGGEHKRSLWGNVYCGLTDEEAMVASHSHNMVGETRLKISFNDKVRFCRGWRKEFENDVAWKESCRKFHADEKTTIDLAMRLAIFPDHIFKMLMEVFALYEDGATKDQKLKAKDLKKPDLQHSCFNAMVHLHNDDIEWLLQKIMNKDLSIAEMKKKAKELKDLQKVKRAFLIGVGKATWEEATTAYPEETKDELLSNWKDYSFSGGSVPESFSAFISRTMAVNTNDNVSKVNFIKLGQNDISPDVVSKASQLVICKASSTTLKNVSLATRAINVTHGCTLYRLLAMADTVEEALKAKDFLSGQNWTGIDLGFWYNPDVNKPQQIGQMKDKVTAFVVAYWTPNGKTNQDFTMIDIDNCWKLKSEAAFFDRVIQVFSCETDHVMSCFFSSNGNATLAARRHGREVTCIRETEMQLDDVRCILSVEE